MLAITSGSSASSTDFCISFAVISALSALSLISAIFFISDSVYPLSISPVLRCSFIYLSNNSIPSSSNSFRSFVPSVSQAMLYSSVKLFFSSFISFLTLSLSLLASVVFTRRAYSSAKLILRPDSDSKSFISFSISSEVLFVVRVFSAVMLLCLDKVLSCTEASYCFQ